MLTLCLRTLLSTRGGGRIDALALQKELSPAVPDQIANDPARLSAVARAMQTPNTSNLADHIQHTVGAAQNPYRRTTEQDLQNMRIDTARTPPDAMTAISDPRYGFRITDRAAEAALKAAARQGGGDPEQRYRELALVAYLSERSGQGQDPKSLVELARGAGCKTITEKDFQVVHDQAQRVYASIDLMPKYRGTQIPDDLKPLLSRDKLGPSLSSREVDQIVRSEIVMTRVDGYQRLRDLYPRSAEDYRAAAALLAENDIKYEVGKDGRPIITDPRISDATKEAWAKGGAR